MSRCTAPGAAAFCVQKNEPSQALPQQSLRKRFVSFENSFNKTDGIDISICCRMRWLLIYHLAEIRTFFALLIYQFPRGRLFAGGANGRKKRGVKGVPKRRIL